MGERSEEDPLEALEARLGTSIIEEVPGSATGFQFTHALIQETLAGELSEARRVRLHALVGQASEELYGDNAEAHAAELAFHFAEAEPMLSPANLVRYSLLAGERALAAYAYEEALTHFDRALGAKQDSEMDSETAAGSFGLGCAQAVTRQGHDLQGAFDSMRRAVDFYVQAGLKADAVAVAEYPVSAL